MNAVLQPAAPVLPASDRSKFIGGSDIAAILGISPWKSSVDLWLDKRRPRTIDDSGNAMAKRRGSRLEPYIVTMIEEEHGLHIAQRNQRYIDQHVPFFACEIDAESWTDDDIDNVEIKTVHPFKAKEWGTEQTDELPVHYVAQTQWGLGITGRARCHVFALIGDDLKRYEIVRDDETIGALREHAANWWQNYIVGDTKPPIEYDRPDVMDTLKRLYPGTDGKVIEATALHEHFRAVYETALDMRSKYDGLADGARAHLLADMGESTAIKFSDGKAFTRARKTRKGYTVEPITYVDFRLGNLKGQE